MIIEQVLFSDFLTDWNFKIQFVDELFFFRLIISKGNCSRKIIQIKIIEVVIFNLSNKISLLLVCELTCASDDIILIFPDFDLEEGLLKCRIKHCSACKVAR